MAMSTKKANPNPEDSTGLSPIGGINFEMGLLTLFALSGFEFFKNKWKLSHENKKCGKFDDLVFRTDEGDILVQAKHKKNKNVLYENQFWSTNPNSSDFSLAKYMVSYATIPDKCNIKHLILCTNGKLLNSNARRKSKCKFGKGPSTLPNENSKFGNIPNANFENSIFEEKVHDKIETISKIFKECKMYSIKLECTEEFKKKVSEFILKQKGGEKLEVKEENIVSFLSKFVHASKEDIETLLQSEPDLQNFTAQLKDIVKNINDNINPEDTEEETVSDKDINSFMSKFVLLKISDREIETLVQEKLKFAHSSYEYVTNRVGKWYAEDHSEPLKNNDIKLILYWEKSRNDVKKFIDKLIDFREYDGTLKSYNILYVNNKQYFDLYLAKILQDILNTSYKGKPKDIFYDKILFLAQESTFEVIIDILECFEVIENDIPKCFEVSKVEYLVVNFTEFGEEEIKQLCEKVDRILKKYPSKKFVIVAKELHFVDTEYIKIKEYNTDIDFEMLDDKTQKKMLDKNIFFQGQRIKFEELSQRSSNSKELFSTIDESVISMINNPKYSIGKRKEYLQQKEPYHISRCLISETTKCSEDELLRNITKRVVIISGAMGSGKTTILENLIKELMETLTDKSQNLVWVINPKLSAMIKYLNKYKDESQFFDLLYEIEGLESKFEKYLMNSLEKFIILDGIDETCSIYIEQLQNLIANNLNLNISTLVIGTRNYDVILQKLRSFNDLEIFALQSFTERDQLQFFKEYIHSKTNGQIELEQIEELFKKLTLFAPEIKQHCSTPLSLQLVADIVIQNDNNSSLLTETFSKKMNGYELYKLLFEEKGKTFVKKFSHNDLTVTPHIKEIFNYYLTRLTEFAAKSLLPETLDEFCFIDRQIDLGEMTLCVGVVEHADDGFRFVHESFKEYFAAEYIWNTILQKKPNSKLLLILVNDVFLNIQYSGVCKFFDGILDANRYEKQQIILDITKQYGDIINQLKWNESRNISSLAFQGYFNIVKLLFDQYKNFSDIINIRGPSDETALHLSAHYRHFVRYLVEKGADVNYIDENGLTIFHYVIMMCWDSEKFNIYFNIMFEKMKNKKKNFKKNLKSVTFFDEYVELLRRDKANGYGSNVNCDDVQTLIKYLCSKGLKIDIADKDGDTAVHWVAQADLLNLLIFLVEDCKLHVNKRNKNGDTPLHYACYFDAVDVVKYIIKISIFSIYDLNADQVLFASSINTTKMLKYLTRRYKVLNNNGDSLIHRAAAGNAVNVLKYLIDECKMDANQLDKYQNTALHDAAMNDSLEAFKYLETKDLHKCAVNKHGDTILHKAAYGNAIHVLRHINDTMNIEPFHGFNGSVNNINFQTVNKQGDSIFHKAAGGNATDVLGFLINECKMNPNVSDRYGNTPLHDAAESDALEAIQYLRSCDSLSNEFPKNDIGHTLLHKAATGDAARVMKYLVEDCGLDPNITDKFKNTPLHYAAKKNSVQIIRYLKGHSADLNCKNNNGETLVHRAASGNALDALKYLIKDCNMEPNASDAFGNKPIHDAAENNAVQVIRYLQTRNVNLMEKNNDGDTLVHKAAKGNAVDVLEYLIEYCGMNPSINDNYGNVPLHDAVQNGSLEAAKYLQ